MSKEASEGFIHHLNGMTLRVVDRIKITSAGNRCIIMTEEKQIDNGKPARFSTTGKTPQKEKRTISTID
jgi:hypothetical protein